MSRGVIGGIVAVVIAALTGAAYFVTTSNFERKVVADATRRVANAQDLLIQNASLEALGLLKQVEAAARDEVLLEALEQERDTDKEQVANRAFRAFLAKLDEGVARPDFMALADKDGNLVALLDVSRPAPDSWKNSKGEVVYPAVRLALSSRIITSDVWDYEPLKSLMKVGVAPIIDNVDEVAGALVVAYSLTAKETRRQEQLLGLDVAYFDTERVRAASFTVANGEEDVGARDTLSELVFADDYATNALAAGLAEKPISVSVAGKEFLATAGKLPRFANKPLPADYPAPATGAVVLMSLTDAKAPLAGIQNAILMLGLGAILVAIVGIVATAKSLLGPLDEIELGVNEVINGNIDRTFRPIGSDVDGLANALNVMLARLLGRPEPGDEEYDEQGNIIGSAQSMSFDAEVNPEKNAEAVALAQEPEAEYYKRIFDEYVEARRGLGDDVSGINYDSFRAKLRLTEGKLKTKHDCSAVRFKVVVKNDRVTLKPVPIV